VWFSDGFIIWIAINSAFIWRPQYNNKKNLIDSFCNKIGKTICEIISKVDSYIPKYKDPQMKTE